MKQRNIRTIFLTICSLSYLLVGAAIFSAMEYDADQDRRRELRRLEEKLRKTYNITESDLKDWTFLLNNKANINAKLYQWSFAGSVYFATTVITTIGKSVRISYSVPFAVTRFYLYSEVTMPRKKVTKCAQTKIKTT